MTHLLIKVLFQKLLLVCDVELNHVVISSR